nr:NADH dehydrogenase subunit 1 [Semimytilus algosus]
MVVKLLKTWEEKFSVLSLCSFAGISLFLVVSYYRLGEGVMWFLKMLFPFVCVLLGVGFFTLLERKLLSAMMLRKGPNKVGFMGLLQPFSDAGKLFCKEIVFPHRANIIPFVLAPGFMLTVSLLLWLLYPFQSGDFIFIFGLLQFVVTASVAVYGVMVAGWSSNSKYALLGCVRSVAQSISYEIAFSTVIFSLVGLFMSFFVQEIFNWQEGFFFCFMSYPLGLVFWLVFILAEGHRAPFDFVEGESELVSGFNVEYSGGLFALIFMSEYSSMLLNSVFSSFIFFGGSEVFSSLVFIAFVFFFVWVRGSFPRMRYDSLMKVGWTSFTVLPLLHLLTFFTLAYV